MLGKLRNMASIYLFKNNQVLLLYRQGSSIVNNLWTGSAGGHFEKFELNDAKACILREMNEELGLGEMDIEDLKLKYITLKMTNGEIRQNYYFFANLKDEVDANLHSNEGICRWFDLNEIHDLKMPFTAKYVMEHFCEQGCKDEILYVGTARNNKVEFLSMNEF